MELGKQAWIKIGRVLLPPLLLLMLLLFFPFSITIIDALSLQPLADYSIQIHFWRTVFEPFLGPLLYFKRSINPLQEVPMAILWGLVIYLLHGFWKYKKMEDKSGGGKYFLRKLSNLPLILGMGFAYFLLVLFIPLPTNTIVNNSEHDILVTTHAHSEFSHDGLISPIQLWEWHKRNGFDALFITEHAHHHKTLEFSRQQRNSKFPMDPLVMVGQEYSGSNHMSLLGLNGSFVTKGKTDAEIVDLTHRHGGAVIVNHWFDGKGKEKEFYTAMGVDGFEIENVGKKLYYNRLVFKNLKEHCEENGLIMVGGLDYHGYGRGCSLWNAFTIPNWHKMNPKAKESAILQILRDRDQSKLKVLMYRDRPFYEGIPPLISPPINALYYFRTLNGYQVASWIVWWAIFQLFLVVGRSWLMYWEDALPLGGGLSATFMLILGVIYYLKDQTLQGYSSLYAEYGTLLLTIGGIYILYAGYLIRRRFFRVKI
ncbi:PHP domain-containing protein [Arenibacter amylolyticus]|uniref:PHP domain-containing protein n=1 Tax=Arenibacter amylolyticus TaxID=1406873 RepID=UPI0011243334|nr:PHP domain-containing protein [Arenibacter amylolyticus]